MRPELYVQPEDQRRVYTPESLRHEIAWMWKYRHRGRFYRASIRFNVRSIRRMESK